MNNQYLQAKLIDDRKTFVNGLATMYLNILSQEFEYAHGPLEIIEERYRQSLMIEGCVSEENGTFLYVGHLQFSEIYHTAVSIFIDVCRHYDEKALEDNSTILEHLHYQLHVLRQEIEIGKAYAGLIEMKDVDNE